MFSAFWFFLFGAFSVFAGFHYSLAWPFATAVAFFTAGALLTWRFGPVAVGVGLLVAASHCVATIYATVTRSEPGGAGLVAAAILLFLIARLVPVSRVNLSR